MGQENLSGGELRRFRDDRAASAENPANSGTAALPQCGFSAMAATLCAGRVVTVGTLVAVILSTSDEMIPVFLAHQAPLDELAGIVALKVVVGAVVGLAVDATLRAWRRSGDGRLHIHELCAREHCHCDEADDGHGHHDHGRWGIVRSALVHTVQVTLFILVVTFAFGLVIEYMGQDAPGALLASGGMGLLVLWRTNADARQNAAVTAFVYAVAVATGLAVGGLGILF
ncbi:MAG: arsenic efflux protein [Atopobiaceae bacterium]|nr:arsenic efflux protein [Atopobiaceae bacterium]